MTGVTTAGLVVATAAAGDRINPEAVLGALAPLVSADVSWVLMARTVVTRPDRLTGVLVQALAVKMVLFGVYVGVLLGVLDLRPVPFVMSFAGAFVALHVMEALFLRRLLMDGAPPPGGERAQGARRYDASKSR
jgi:hypothetical protein